MGIVGARYWKGVHWSSFVLLSRCSRAEPAISHFHSLYSPSRCLHYPQCNLATEVRGLYRWLYAVKTGMMWFSGGTVKSAPGTSLLIISTRHECQKVSKLWLVRVQWVLCQVTCPDTMTTSKGKNIGWLIFPSMLTMLTTCNSLSQKSLSVALCKFPCCGTKG